jgi:hypothetical protein
MDESVKEILALKEMALDADEDKCRLIVQEMQVRFQFPKVLVNTEFV